MYCFLVHLLWGRGASLRTVTLWLLEKKAGGVFRTLTVSISSMLAFTLWSFYIKICTSGSLKLPCIDVSMQISHSQTTSTIFTAVEVRLERNNFPCSQASQGQDAPSFLSCERWEWIKGRRRKGNGLSFTELLLVLHPFSPFQSLCFVSVAPLHMWLLGSRWCQRKIP